MKLVLAVLLLLAGSAATAKDWTLDAKASRLRFAGTQQDEAFSGEFARFTPKIAYDAAKPAETKIDVEVDLASADSKSPDRDEQLKGAEFFAVAKYPKAHFKTLACKPGAAAGQVECDAELTIRDKTRKLAFPFTFVENGGAGRLRASVELDRTQFDVGTGEWLDEATVGHKVKVTVDLTLR